MNLQIFRSVVWLVAPIALCGCLDSPPKGPIKKKDEVKKKEEQQAVLSTAGSMDVFGPEPAREKRWTIYWANAEVTTEGMKPVIGNLKTVRGQIYQKGKPEMDFVADTAHGDKEHRKLTLLGSVKVTSKDRGSTLLADSIEYTADDKLLRARGNVRVTDRVGSLESVPELVATSDLKKVATPDAFTAK